MIEKIRLLIEHNSKIIDAIDEGYNINMPKAIKACLLSNNRLAEIILEMKKDNKNTDKMFDSLFGGFK